MLSLATPALLPWRSMILRGAERNCYFMAKQKSAGADGIYLCFSFSASPSDFAVASATASAETMLVICHTRSKVREAKGRLRRYK